MTQPTYEAQLRRLARVLAEIAHSLESVDGPQVRIERTLTLLGQVIPYSRCALYEVNDDESETLYIVPSQSDGRRDMVAEGMRKVFHLISRAQHIERPKDTVPSLSLPLIGLDSTIGVIRVEPDGTSYDATHLRILAVVAAQLSAYLTTVRLRERDRVREEKLAAAHDFQQLLAGIVSHDLRNPLTVITAVASNLLTRTTDARQAESLRRALRNAEHAARLISDLTDVTEARVSGVIGLTPRPHGLLGLVETILDDLRQAHPSATIELVCEVDASVEVTWDVERMTQVLVNLINNAVAHGAAALPVRVAVWTENSSVLLSVHNYGVQIAPELLPAIFDPFAHGSKRPRTASARGLGLGLFIVDQIVKAHNGSIDVASDELHGTTFRVRLPRVCAVSQAATDSPLIETAALTGDALVMVVDDDADVRAQMAVILSRRGFKVVAANDGLHALELLREGVRPKLILLDLSMPRMSGEELCEALQQEPAFAKIPVVVISADTAAALRMSRDRARAFLAKPVSLSELLATIGAIQ